MDESNKRKRSWEKVMSNFTDDLWIEIFLRLPFESLLGFKSVSKSWFSIISSHRFAQSHLETAPKDDDSITVHHELIYCDCEEEDGNFALLDLGSGFISKNLKFPYSQDWPVTKKAFDIYLWNPATQHSKLIPPYTLPDLRWTCGSLGFGFDHIDLDFKVVRVVSPSHSAQVYSTLSAEVYSSNNNNWRKIESKPIDFPCESNFHVLHGFLFAIGHNNSMLAFNLNKEVFICNINLPLSTLDDAKPFDIQTCVTDFENTIAFIISILNKGKINLWTLDNEASVCTNGVKASWTKVLSVDVGVPLGFVHGLFNNVQFLLSASDESDVNQFLYNWNNKVTIEVPTGLFLERGQFFKYTKSLFSLLGFKRIKCDASSRRLEDSSDLEGSSD
ncbi:hypothetical protein POM88_026788 [Heracleum sosnowskyi]|uniref:F-box domain-containing protein n=1 Tax=Heracleum sosnowskyi TaxID=360622 RepID=A0AAD8MPK0_9APIA|nr:hypothetical protein POM88_026788 [Heracleum sosnowskyi]